MRVSGDPAAANNGLFYIHSDHLGSTSVLTKYSDGYIRTDSLTRYAPFGTYRQGDPSPLTDRGFTGQRENMSDLGLMYYNARYYLPSLGRFLSADTIVPDPARPQSLNRFSYVENRPLNLVDPTGHCGADKDPDGGVNIQAEIDCKSLRSELQDLYELKIKGVWLLAEMEILKLSLQDVKAKFGLDAFLDVFSGTVVKRYRKDGGGNVGFPSNVIKLRNGVFAKSEDSARWIIVHEFGHRWDAKNGLSLSADFEAAMGGQTTGFGCGFSLGELLLPCEYKVRGNTVGEYAKNNRREDFADTFASVVFNGTLANVVSDGTHEIQSNALTVAVDRIDYVEDLIQSARN